MLVITYSWNFFWYAEHFLRKHVFRDLQPYVCTFEKCPQGDELYGSQHEWFSHEVQFHRREWYCGACEESFPQKTLFQEHITVRHSEIISKGHFEAVVSRCERAVVTEIVCPLCGNQFTLQALEKHLALHLQEVALLALPRSEGVVSAAELALLHPDGLDSEWLSTRGFITEDPGSLGTRPPRLGRPRNRCERSLSKRSQGLSRQDSDWEDLTEPMPASLEKSRDLENTPKMAKNDSLVENVENRIFNPNFQPTHIKKVSDSIW